MGMMPEISPESPEFFITERRLVGSSMICLCCRAELMDGVSI